MKLKLILPFFFLAFFIVGASTSFAASEWDFSEDWNSGSDNLIISKTGSPWFSDCSYTSYTYGAHYDNYSSRYGSSPYSCHLGTTLSTSSSSSPLYYYYLMRGLGSATSADGYLDFWHYHYYGMLYVEYTTSATISTSSSWSTISSFGTTSSYYYAAYETVKVPAGATGIRFRSYTRLYYSYGVWIDDISFKVYEAPISAITGFSEGDDNAGVLDITIYTQSVYPEEPVETVSLYYSLDYDEEQIYIGSDSDGSDGWQVSFNTGNILNVNVHLHAYSYVSGEKRGYRTESFGIRNPIFTEFLPNPAVDGQILSFGASYQEGEFSDIWPTNPWYSMYNSYTSTLRLYFNTAERSPYAGTYVSYFTDFCYASTSGSHTFQLISYNGSTYTVIASGPSTVNTAGNVEYAISSSGFSNLPAGLIMGCYYNYAGYRNYSNNASTVYYSSTGGATGAITTSIYSTSDYSVPLRAKVVVQTGMPTKAQFGYSLDGETIAVALGETGFSGTTASYAWDSTDLIDNAYIYPCVRAYTGTKWGGWNIAEDPIHVINKIEADFNTSMGDGVILFQGEEIQVPFSRSLNVCWETQYSYDVGTPMYQLVTENAERWRFINWDNGSTNLSSTVSLTSDMLEDEQLQFIAHFTQQFYFSSVQPVIGIVSPNEGYYDAGTQIVSTAPQLITVTQFSDRYFCSGWTVDELDLSSDIPEASFLLTGKATLVWNYDHQVALSISNDLGASNGAFSGWYSAGANITVSVPRTVTSNDNDNTRSFCTGYTATGDLSEGSSYSTGQFTITQPTKVVWSWKTQHYLSISTNIGSVYPGSSWYDEGTEVSISTTSPDDTSTVKYGFISWEGTGAGSSSVNTESTSVIVNTPVSQVASWNTYYLLTVVAENGSLSPDPSGWYLMGSEVNINVETPLASTGVRWVPEWVGDSPAVTMERGPSTPTFVTVQLTGPVTQTVRFYKQLLLNILNSNSNAFVYPSAGHNWLFEGEEISGYAQYATDNFLCSGFTSFGSVVSSDSPYFSLVMTLPTTLSWNWVARQELPEQFWNLPTELSSNTISAFDSAILADGTIVTAFFSEDDNAIHLYTGNGTSWNSKVIASDVSGVTGICVGVNEDGETYVVYQDDSEYNLYILTQAAGAVGVNAWAVTVLDEIGDVGRSADIAFDKDDKLFISYLDSGNGELKLVTFDGEWSIETINVDGFASSFASCAINPVTGLPVIAYYDSSIEKLCCAIREEGGWSFEVVDPTGKNGFYCNVNCSPSGEIFIAYQDVTETNNPVVKIATKVYDEWTVALVSENSGFGLDFILTDDCDAHIVSHNGENIVYARYVDGEWEVTEIPNPDNLDGSIAAVLLPEGKPGVFFIADEKFGYIDALADTLVNIEEQVVVDDETNDGDSNGGGGGCFVATAAFGSLSVSHVSALTSFRDSCLGGSETSLGLVQFYYVTSPAVASDLSGSEAARALLREFLAW